MPVSERNAFDFASHGRLPAAHYRKGGTEKYLDPSSILLCDTLEANVGCSLFEVCMKRHIRNLRCLVFPLLLASSATLSAMAQQGQYRLGSVPFTLPGMPATGAIATYAPIKLIDDQQIQVRTDDGQAFTFTLDAHTVYCQGGAKASNWGYLRRMGKKKTVTILTNSDEDNVALVIWDQGPDISISAGQIVFSLPPMCR